MTLVGYTVQSADDGIGGYIKLFKRKESAQKAANEMNEYISGYRVVETTIDVIE